MDMPLIKDEKRRPGEALFNETCEQQNKRINPEKAILADDPVSLMESRK
jgi:hypothetical protein